MSSSGSSFPRSSGSGTPAKTGFMLGTSSSASGAAATTGLPTLGAGKSYKLVLWGDQGITTSGSEITSWTDITSGNNWIANARSAGTRPSVATAFFGGKNAVYFDNAGDCMEIASFAINTSFTIFVSADIDQAGGWGYFIEQGPKIDTTPGFFLNSDKAHADPSLVGINRAAGGVALFKLNSPNDLLDTRTLVVGAYNASTQTAVMKQNGVDLAQTTGSGTPPTTETLVTATLNIGARSDNGVLTTAWISAIIICEGALSGTEITSVSNYIIAQGY